MSSKNNKAMDVLRWLDNIKARGTAGWYYLHRVNRREKMHYNIEWQVHYITSPDPPNELIGKRPSRSTAKQLAEAHHQGLRQAIDFQHRSVKASVQ